MLVSPVFSNEPFVEADDSVTIAICKVGSLAHDGKGKIFRFTETGLQSSAPSWAGGIVRTVHKHPENGKIERSWYEAPFAMAVVSGLSPTMREIMKTPAYLGVSQESIPTKIGDMEMIRGQPVWNLDEVRGTGVSIMLYPETPACPLEAGCGIPIMSGEIPSMEGESKSIEYDVARMNNAGMMIKTREFTLWIDTTDTSDTIKSRIASEASYGQVGSFNLYARDSSLQVGDAIMDTANPLHSITTIVSSEPETDSSLNTESPDFDADTNGGPDMGENEDNAKLIAEMAAENANLKAQLEAINAAKEQERLAAEKAEIDVLATELKSCMPTGFEGYMSTKPRKEDIKAVIQGIRSSAPVGTAGGSGGPEKTEATAIFSSGKAIYEKMGLTLEQFIKNSGV